jgi:hypothetical protein
MVDHSIDSLRTPLRVVPSIRKGRKGRVETGSLSAKKDIVIRIIEAQKYP